MIGENSAMEERNRTASRPRRTRLETQRIFHGANPNEKSLELSGVVKVLSSYSDYEGGINCSICGKLYKSKVCFTKHIWEHSVYWDQFSDEKNHDRVLSIQAALIMYSRFHGDDTGDALTIDSLLVTSPHDKKKDLNNNENNNNNFNNNNRDEMEHIHGVPEGYQNIVARTPENKSRNLPSKLRSPRMKSSSKNRRKRSLSSSSSSSTSTTSSLSASLPGPGTGTYSFSDLEMSPNKSARQM